MVRLFSPKDAPKWLGPVLQSIRRAIEDKSLESYTVATLPKADLPVRQIYVSDETGGAVTAFNDGTDWRRSTDRAIVS